MQNAKLFQDLLVVELASVLAGPAVGMFFAELGAKVIKIENKKTAGDVTRSWKLAAEDPTDEYSAYYHSINWGKDKKMLDLGADEDRSEVLALIKKADIVISNFKQDSAVKLKMDYASLKVHKPDLIYGTITAYGDESSAPGFDVMIQAETGWISMNGAKDGPPAKLPVALVDILAAHQLKQGLLIALLKRAQSGVGSFVSISLFDASIAALANQASNWLNVNALPKRMGSQHPNIAPYGDIFYTKDEVCILLGTGTQKQFENLCKVLELDTLTEDKRFLTNALRLANREALVKALAEAFKDKTYPVLKVACQELKVTIAPVNNMEAVFQMPAVQKLILTETLPNGEVVKSVRTAVFKIQ